MRTKSLLRELGVDEDAAARIDELMADRPQKQRAAFHLLLQEQEVQEIARQLAVTRQTINRWKQGWSDVKEELRGALMAKEESMDALMDESKIAARECDDVEEDDYVKKIIFRATRDFKTGLHSLAMLDGLTVQDEIVQTICLQAEQEKERYRRMALGTWRVVESIEKAVTDDWYSDFAREHPDFDPDPVAEFKKQMAEFDGLYAKYSQYKRICGQLRTTLKWEEPVA